MIKFPSPSTLSRLILPIALAAAASACTQDEPKVEEIVKAEKAEPKADPAHEFKVGDDGKVVFTAEIVYFKYDDHTLTEEGQKRLDALAGYLKANPAQKLKIEGHCDERGSPEYNLALGQRRGQSVRSYLANVGVAEPRLEVVTFGEEKPAAQGSGEDNWAQNRRAEFTLTSAPAE